jgi:serine/threonine protein kinase
MNNKYPLALPEGTILAGQYVIEKALGQGGFGITYKARDHKTGNTVAVKEFFPETLATRTQCTVVPFDGERGENYEYGKTCFLQEAETLAQFIGNENIVKIYSYFEEYGTAYFVMEFIEGINFDEYIKQRGGRVSYEEAENVLIKIIDVKNSDLTAEIFHVLNHLIGLCFPHSKFVFVHIKLLYHLNKCIDCEGIMLHAYAELLFYILLFNIAVLHQFILLNNLSGITQKFLTFHRKDHTTVSASEQLRSDLFLQFLYRLG